MQSEGHFVERGRVACTSRSNVGQRGKKALEWPLTLPCLCFTIQMVNQLLMIFWPFFCSQSMHAKKYTSLLAFMWAQLREVSTTHSLAPRDQTLHWSGTLVLICQSAQLVLLGSTARKPLKRPPPKNAHLCWQGKTTKHQHSNLLT